MIDDVLRKIESREDLPAEEAEALFDLVFDGKLDDAKLIALLTALRDKGEALSELQGAVRALRRHMLSIHAPDGTVDIIGTGSAAPATLNVSTGAAFVVAGANVPVAKHSNRSASSVSGASDMMRALGLNLEPTITHLEQALNEVGIAFLFAPRHHPVLRHVESVRQKMQGRTLFNLLIPMANPAHTTRHMIGVYDARWAQPMAQTLAALGSESAWITHGADGLDELSTTGASQVVALQLGALRAFTLTPEETGLDVSSLEELRGGDADMNALALRAMLDGKKGPYRDIVLLNAAGALQVAGQADTIKEAIELAAQSIDSGAAKHKLDSLIALSRDEETFI